MYAMGDSEIRRQNARLFANSQLWKTDKNGNPRLSLQFSGERVTFSIKTKGGVPDMIRLALVEDDEL